MKKHTIYQDTVPSCVHDKCMLPRSCMVSQSAFSIFVLCDNKLFKNNHTFSIHTFLALYFSSYFLWEYLWVLKRPQCLVVITWGPI